MPAPLKITLTDEQRCELEALRDHGEKPYLRERAAAIWKVAHGMTARQVALQGLLKGRDPDTIYAWMHRWQSEGITGLFIRSGRGRKPAFPPQQMTAEQARLTLLHVMRREPAQFGFLQSRWTLVRLLQACDWLALTSLGGLSQLLRRLKISYQRARSSIHSPDPYYSEKLSRIELARLRAKYAPQQAVFLYLDEMTYYRQPSLSWTYAAQGSDQPLAQLSHRSNTSFRIVAALNALTGKVNYRQRSRTSVDQLSAFYADLRTAYPHADTIYVAQDNWPVHFHPDVLARLEPQQWPYPFNVPGNWPTQASKRAVQDDLPIQILCLPTYASWCNPIEKLWRWLKQDILHLHRLSDQWHQLKQRVATFLDQFHCGSSALLHYVGLLPD